MNALALLKQTGPRLRSRVFLTVTVLCVAPATLAAVSWKSILKQPAAWYGSTEARTIADNVLAYQRSEGGWPKNHDETQPPGPHDFDEVDVSAPTIDNDATYTEIRFLAQVNAARPDPRYSSAIDRGLGYLLAAQYENGGWPQFYPLRKGYYTHITFNDDAMIGTMELLRDVSAGTPPFIEIAPPLRARAREAVKKGVECILRCQVAVNGHKTVWCAQHDEVTLAPAPARKYEHISLSGYESVGVVRFLMGIEHPSPEIREAIESAVAWFRQVKIVGLRVVAIPSSLPKPDRKVVDDPNAPPFWARFYEIGTNRPIFSGRDSIIRYRLSEIELERRAGYRWYVTEPEALISRDYPAWKARVGPTD